MRHANHLTALACLSLLAAPVWADGVKAEGRANAPGQLLEVQILGLNDYHAHVLPDAAGTVDGEAAGGGEYLASKLRQLRTVCSESLSARLL